MTKHQNQLRADEASIDEETAPIPALDIRLAERAGRFRALAGYYATMADMQAGQLKALRSNVRALGMAILDLQPSPGEIATLLYDLSVRLAGDRNYDWDGIVQMIEAAGDSAFQLQRAMDRSAEDAADIAELERQQKVEPIRAMACPPKEAA